MKSGKLSDKMTPHVKNSTEIDSSLDFRVPNNFASPVERETNLISMNSSEIFSANGNSDETTRNIRGIESQVPEKFQTEMANPETDSKVCELPIINTNSTVPVDRPSVSQSETSQEIFSNDIPSATTLKSANRDGSIPNRGGSSHRRESSVPSGQMARIANFAGLGIGLALGTVGELARKAVTGTLQSGGGIKGLVLNEKNSERLTLALCRMRGAALKLGQLLSIQDEHVIPKDSPLRAVIDRVREEAENMPPEQLYRVLRSELGSDWRSRLASFEDTPMAAASIGQVLRLGPPRAAVGDPPPKSATAPPPAPGPATLRREVDRC